MMVGQRHRRRLRENQNAGLMEDNELVILRINKSTCEAGLQQRQVLQLDLRG